MDGRTLATLSSVAPGQTFKSDITYIGGCYARAGLGIAVPISYRNRPGALRAARLQRYHAAPLRNSHALQRPVRSSSAATT